MPAARVFLLSFIFYLLVLSIVEGLSSFISPVLAAATPTPIPPTCDLCGWCNRNAPTPAPSPPNWNQCMTCLYNTDGSSRKNAYYTVLGCFSTDPTGAPFVRSILAIVFGVAGGIAFLAVIAGSGIVLTSAGNPDRLQIGKDMITSSLFGILLIIFSIFLLRIVGYDILNIPGFG